MVVTFIPIRSLLLLNLPTSAQARFVLPTFLPAEPIINIPSSLTILPV
jgi:hypothetical protein